MAPSPALSSAACPEACSTRADARFSSSVEPRCRRSSCSGMNREPVTDELCAGDLMSRTFVSAAPEDALGELAEHLAEADAGSALVLEFGQLTGILTRATSFGPWRAEFIPAREGSGNG